ncbi:chromophore lyase CpcT/CpeT [Costertonia aggregata]|uniref:Chromophore lyase CpcT/CpeT n=1 Tax=Costertonia aggregata TaxID=343403 RepID=A0A7H9ANK3_9FLAO|nr:chromophore lyase CpcT/CpeT [Costertonia aggregata]QLG45008.1 chromophore lyase CpcT/CpeT [Costertonia aggregata]
MKKLRFLTFPILAVISLQASLASAPFDFGDPNVRDLGLIAKWFEGEFDNDEQLWVEGRSDWWGKADEKHGRIHAIHKRIKADSIGKYVFYIEEYMDNDPTKVGRQRIVSFESMGEKNPGIVMKLYFLKEADKYLMASETHEAMLANMTKDALFGLDGCDVIFQRVGQQFHGSMREKACQFGKGDELRYSVHDMIVSENEYWRVDRTFLVKDDSFFKGHPNAEPHKMRKAKVYTCDVSFYEKAYYLPSEKDKNYKDLKVHDQGGTAHVLNPVDGKTYFVQLRNKEYPFYDLSDSDFFFLRFKEEGAQASLALAFAEPNAKKIGFQMNWASAVCECEQ